MIKYVLDSNIFIQLWRYNPISIPMYGHIWKALDDAISLGVIMTEEVVLLELGKGSDGLKPWVQSKSGLVIPTGSDTLVKVSEVMASCPDLGGIDTEKNHADPFVVACGFLNNATVVCNERRRNGKNERWKVPDACDEFGVPCIDFIGFANAFPWL